MARRLPLHCHCALLAVAAPLSLFNLADALLHQRSTIVGSGNPPPLTDVGSRSLAVERADAEFQYAGIGSTPGESGALLRNLTWVVAEERFFHAKSDGKQSSMSVNQSLPLKWLHIPKTGSSFINTIINVPNVCPGLPDDTYVSDETMGGKFLGEFNRRYDIARVCPGLDRTNSDKNQGGFGHIGLGKGSDYKWNSKLQRKKTMFTFMRQPEQRIISAYNDMLRALKTGTSVNGPTRSFAWSQPTPPRTLREYAQVTSGCAVRMMTRSGYPCGGPEEATHEEIDEAKRRLRTDFAFVGITDEWNLSICLFSKMFDTTCRSHQFQNSRPGVLSHRATNAYSTWRLVGYKDRVDGELYDEAKRIFKENVERYNVSDAGCQKCFHEAGLV